MSLEKLKNPIWYSLTTEHKKLALGDQVKKYPSDMALFAAVKKPEDFDEKQLKGLMDPAEKAIFVGEIPKFSNDWEVVKNTHVTQMICRKPVLVPKAQWEIRELKADDVPQMIELTNKVFPEYFRPNSLALGPYLGIFEKKTLIAMVGIRMRIPGFEEVSTLCTHPDFGGKGLGRYIFSSLTMKCFEQKLIPFGHVVEPNEKAVGMYENFGWSVHQRLPMLVVRLKEDKK